MPPCSDQEIIMHDSYACQFPSSVDYCNLSPLILNVISRNSNADGWCELERWVKVRYVINVLLQIIARALRASNNVFNVTFEQLWDIACIIIMISPSCPQWGIGLQQCLFSTGSCLLQLHVPLPMTNPSHLVQFQLSFSRWFWVFPFFFSLPVST